MSEREINRFVMFPYAPIYDFEDTSGANNSWQYFRAPAGYIFLLDSAIVNAVRRDVTGLLERFRGIVAFYDGHEYTHWNQFPGVESRELVGRAECSEHQLNHVIDFRGWECKEFTLGVRSTDAVRPFKSVVILFYMLKRASRTELLEYAIKHPIVEDSFKRALRGTTVELEEA